MPEKKAETRPKYVRFLRDVEGVSSLSGVNEIKKGACASLPPNEAESAIGSKLAEPINVNAFEDWRRRESREAEPEAPSKPKAKNIRVVQSTKPEEVTNG